MEGWEGGLRGQRGGDDRGLRGGVACQLLATNKHASAVMPTLPPGGPDGGLSRA